MSRENVEVVRRWIEFYNRREIERLLGLSDADCEIRSVFATLESDGVFHGHAGLVEYFAALDDAYEHFRLVPRDFIDAGEAVLMPADVDWRGKESGAQGSMLVFPVLWLREGKLYRERTFTHEAEALEAVGLRE